MSEELLVVFRELKLRSLREAHALGSKKFPREVRRELKDIFEALGDAW